MTREERKEALDVLTDMANVLHLIPTTKQGKVFEMVLQELQKPEQKQGKWIYPNVPAQYVDGQECSECGFSLYGVREYKYCPNCGAKMCGGDAE